MKVNEILGKKALILNACLDQKLGCMRIDFIYLRKVIYLPNVHILIRVEHVHVDRK
jgi:hypothetical protein